MRWPGESLLMSLLHQAKAVPEPEKAAQATLPTSVKGSTAVWTGKGFMISNPGSASAGTPVVGDLGQGKRLTGRAGYGSPDTCPPGIGYGLGRRYD